ncbi:putative maleylacetoacetate isomerase 1 [Hypsibius exemplaris]|uniref:maleylacetoacetate isomerase n=1 Tax=Hypsibius exemplaris TaxID=2072580 RepID=A0A1W0WUP7_HYPEX|nr:putative maleylacetoacetate isomerase 1 [Hypsibius exemplaris]
MGPEKPILYNFAYSSCSWRVRAVLVYKNIDFTYKHYIPVEESVAEYRQLNAMGQVPCLIIDGQTLTQSVAIIEYLEETRPDLPLLPKDPLQRARVRQIVEIINSGIQPLMSPGTAKIVTADIEKQKEWQVYWIEKGLAALEVFLAGTHGKFCVGDELTLADIFLVPQLFSSRRFGADLFKFPKCAQLFQDLEHWEVFEKTHPTRQPTGA